MTGEGKSKPDTPGIDPASPREQVRSWLHWLPMWFLVPLGLGGPSDGQSGQIDGGYGGPLDGPSHGGGFGDYGGGDMGGGF